MVGNFFIFFSDNLDGRVQYFNSFGNDNDGEDGEEKWTANGEYVQCSV